MPTEKVSIGVPVYRGEKFLGKALNAILKQTHTDYEVIISIDGADPVCEGICRPFLKDPRFRMTVQPTRLGWVGNCNWTQSQVTGDFWYYHQQDDLTEPEYLEVLLDHLRKNPQAALAHCDLMPMGRLEKPFTQPPSVTGATAFVRQMTMLHEHWPAFAFRGLTRAAALRTAGPVPENDVTNFGVDICWLAGVARHGELHRVPRGLYYKRYHESNTESKWWAWTKEERFIPWVAHCLNMFEQAARIDGSVGELRMLWLATVDRLTSLSAGAFFLPVKELTAAEHHMLFDAFLQRAKTAAKLNIPLRLDASWTEIEEWTRGFRWAPKEEPYRIEDFGPKKVVAGVVFNRQPNGQSAIWVRLSRPAEPGARIKLDDTVLTTRVCGTALTAFVPDSVIASAGSKPLVIVGPSNEIRSGVASFEVMAPTPIQVT